MRLPSSWKTRPSARTAATVTARTIQARRLDGSAILDVLGAGNDVACEGAAGFFHVPRLLPDFRRLRANDSPQR
jgi:hypothetical protein